MTAVNLTELPEISVGTILVMRAELETVAHTPDSPVKARLRASKLVQLLDELIERRRKDMENA